MRLRTLDLEKFGPFTARTVRFRDDAKLHVLYGPNEAGKSSTLAAIADLLFGFPERTAYGFLHASKDLRLGAEIVDQAGNSLPFRRRKGRSNTIVDAADQPMRDDALAPFLGGLTRQVFCRAFGLDAAALREGAEGIVSADGDVGTTLLAAAAGLKGLADLRKDLDREADAIFAPRKAQDRRFYQAFDRFEKARREITATEVRAPALKKLDDDIAACDATLERLGAERLARRARQRKLQRMIKAAPSLARVEAARAALDAFSELPAVVADLPGRLGAALEERARAAGELDKARAAREAAERALAAIDVDEALLAHADAIDTLVPEVGSFEKAQADLPKVSGELAATEQALARQAIALGLPDAAALENAQPGVTALEGVAAAMREGRDLLAARQQTAKALADGLAERDDLDRDVGPAGALADPAPLREQLRALATLGAEAERHERLARDVAIEAASIAEAAARLDPPVGDLAALARRPLPGAEALARGRKALEEAAKARTRAEDRLATAKAEEDEAARRLESLAAGRPVPSRERIEAARAARDESFATLAEVLLGATDMPAHARAATVARHHGLVTEADSLVDEAGRDAERVATHAAAAQALAARRASSTEAAVVVTRALEAMEAARAAWHALWTEAGVDPRAPEVMAEWLTRLDALLARRERVEALRLEAGALEARLVAATPALAALAERAGLPALPGLGTAEALRRIDTKVGELESQWADVRDRAAKREAVETRLARLTVRETREAAALADWRERFGTALREIGLSGRETIEQAEAALAVWTKVPDLLAARDKDARRIAGIRRDGEKFTRDVAEVVGAVAPDLADLPSGSAIRALRERIAVARETATRRTAARERTRAAQESLTEAERADGVARERVEALVAGMAVAADEVAGFHAALVARARAEEAVAQALDHLADVAEGRAESELRAELDGFDPDVAAATLRETEEEDARGDSAGKEAYAERERLRAARTALETGLGAELAAQERSMAAADLAAAAREWKVLRIGALLLDAALERHRAGRQDPLMQRASALFAGLTGGAWAGIGQTFGENDRAQLVAQRVNGDGTVEIAALSEGTRDQLYLALRLAYLENYAERAEPAPFVGDDLFASFDDDRTARGLEALAAIGDRVQPLLFTHHRAVADLAVARLGAAVDIIEL